MSSGPPPPPPPPFPQSSTIPPPPPPPPPMIPQSLPNSQSTTHPTLNPTRSALPTTTTTTPTISTTNTTTTTGPAATNNNRTVAAAHASTAIITSSTPGTNNIVYTDNDKRSIRAIQRILNCTRIDFISILDLPLIFTVDDVKQKYKELSILIHPDKAPRGFEQDSKVAFTTLNTAKDGLDDETKVKYWSDIVKRAELDVQEVKIRELTQLRQDEAKKLNLLSSSSSSSLLSNSNNNNQYKVTIDELKKMSQYQSWVRDKIKTQLIDDDYKKNLLMKRREHDINEIRQEEERKAQLQKQMMLEERVASGANTSLTDVDPEQKLITTQRAQNWQSFQSSRNGRYARQRTNKPVPTNNTHNPFIVEQSVSLKQQYYDNERRQQQQ